MKNIENWRFKTLKADVRSQDLSYMCRAIKKLHVINWLPLYCTSPSCKLHHRSHLLLPSWLIYGCIYSQQKFRKLKPTRKTVLESKPCGEAMYSKVIMIRISSIWSANISNQNHIWCIRFMSVTTKLENIFNSKKGPAVSIWIRLIRLL